LDGNNSNKQLNAFGKKSTVIFFMRQDVRTSPGSSRWRSFEAIFFHFSRRREKPARAGRLRAASLFFCGRLRRALIALATCRLPYQHRLVLLFILCGWLLYMMADWLMDDFVTCRRWTDRQSKLLTFFHKFQTNIFLSFVVLVVVVVAESLIESRRNH